MPRTVGTFVTQDAFKYLKKIVETYHREPFEWVDEHAIEFSFLFGRSRVEASPDSLRARIYVHTRAQVSTAQQSYELALRRVLPSDPFCRIEWQTEY